jgi:ApbE superfamily uncharacterized protein (UPF0280 family)
MLPDGKRLYIHDGPIDLIVEAFGEQSARTTAYEAASQRFVTILDELCNELPLLRSASGANASPLHGVVARRMVRAVGPFAERHFITPMAAVAGAVAEEILHAMTSHADLTRAYVNNGGDIALHLASDEHFTIGMVERPDRPSLFGAVQIDSSQPVRGIATSGWRGRSFSLGIADAVTILAETAAMADAAATIVANAVDLPGHPAIFRVRACEIAPDNDLGELLVTRDVGPLYPFEIEQAVSAGAGVARELQFQGLIAAAAIHLQGQTQIVAAAEYPPRISLGRHMALAGSAAHA